MKNKKALFNHIAIIGLGLIGSSIARAAKKKNIAKYISAYNKNPDTLKKALGLGIIDTAALTLQEAVKGADLVILCTPIGTYQSITKQIAPHLERGAIITDVGSVKSSVIKMISNELDEEHLSYFIPGHPIAGSEKSGMEAGTVDLFEGRQIILTPTENCDIASTEKIKKFWESCGGHVEFMNADEHDEIYASASHLPHLISFCVASIIGKQEKPVIDEIHAHSDESFKSFMRLAGSNPAMWTDIFIYNKPHIITNLRKFYGAKVLPVITTEIDAENLFTRMLGAKKKRKTLDIKEKSCTSNPTGKAYVFMKILPKIVAGITIESVENTSHVGGGFLGLTENILNLSDKFPGIVMTRREVTNDVITALNGEVEVLQKLIEKSEAEKVNDYIAGAVRVYNRCV